jgi:hypothetical protein
MTHILIQSGSATGGPVPRTLNLDTVFLNPNTFYDVLLQYAHTNTLTIDRFINPNTFFDLVLQHITVTSLTITEFVNPHTFYDIQLVALPFVPVNTETTDILAETTGDYTTTRKIQIDTLITQLKTAGVWSKLDWFCGAMFMANEHDSLIDWTQPTRSLVIDGTPTFTPFGGWQGMASLNNSKLKSGWEPTDGPHSTSTSFTLFVHVESMAAENNAQLAGNWQRSSGGGPTAPEGTFITLNAAANTVFAGANVNAFDGISAGVFTGVPATFAVTRSGTTIEAARNGVSLGTDAAATHFERTHADGLCILGSATGATAGRAFNGFITYGGWGAVLTLSELAAVDTAVLVALDPPEVVVDGLLVDGSDHWLIVDGAGNYLKVR